jgi:hypothetical protein
MPGLIPVTTGWTPVAGRVGDVGNCNDVDGVGERPSLHAVTRASRANAIVVCVPLVTEGSLIDTIAV